MLPHIKVVELASVLAGPAVGMFFAELGAEVIKIENKTTGGDVTRSWKLPSEDPAAPASAYYASVNWGKTVWMCDLQHAEDRDRVLQAIDQADVVISNFRPDAAQKLGMSYPQLSARNPRLLFGQITGFGDDDPLPAFDVVLQAEAGFLYMSGHPGGAPAKMPVALIDLLAAHQLKEGLLLALLERSQTGKGSKVSVSLYHAALASLANQATNWLIAGKIPQRMGTLHPNIAPYGELFACKDGGQIVLAVGNDRQFQQLCKTLKLDVLATAPVNQNLPRSSQCQLRRTAASNDSQSLGRSADVQDRQATSPDRAGSSARLPAAEETWPGHLARPFHPASCIHRASKQMSRAESAGPA